MSAIVERRTRDGRKRAPEHLLGTNFRRPFPFIRVALGLGILGAATYSAYRRHSYVAPQDQFIHKIYVAPYGVMGNTMTLTGSLKRESGEPDELTAVTDPADLSVLLSSASKGVGTSGAIYKWIGLHSRFPSDVVLAISKYCDAKHHEYPGEKHVIHVVSPDFREGIWTEREAAIELSRAYRNALHEFVVSECDNLRLVPLSDGNQSGPLYNQMAPITHEALKMAFEQLHVFDKEYVLRDKKKIELCVFVNRDWDKYSTAFKTL